MRRKGFFLFMALLFMLLGCTGTKLIRSSFSPEELLIDNTTHSKIIKIHLKDGGLYVLDDWQINQSSDTITGYGKYYDFKRNLIKEKMELFITDNPKYRPFLCFKR